MTHPLTQPETALAERFVQANPYIEEEIDFSIGDSGTRTQLDEGKVKAFIRQELETQAKAFGNCTLCYGKGYHTELSGISWSGDFEDTSGNKTLHNINPCTCDRGKQIEKLLTFTKDRERETLLDEVAAMAGKEEDSSDNNDYWGRNQLREEWKSKLTALRKKKL